MVNVSMTSDIDRMAKAFQKLGTSQVPFATSLAINRTAQLAKDTLRNTMARVFDRPKPYTLNSLYIKTSTKTNLVATVGHKDGSPVSRYLQADIQGGSRQLKAIERMAKGSGFLVPAQGLKLDQYGNVSAGVMKRIAEGLATNTGNIFIILPGSSSHLAPGVYERQVVKTRAKTRRGLTVGLAGGGSRPKALLIFVNHVNYKPIYDMVGVVGRVIEAEFGRQFNAAMDYALKTAKVTL